jgi:uncharacterized protein
MERLAPRLDAGVRLVRKLETCGFCAYVKGDQRKSSAAAEKVRAVVPTACNGRLLAMPIDQKTKTELEAAAFRRLVEHLRSRTDVQNIDMMNLAGFCRNCLSNWMKEAADARGVPMTKDESRETIYGMPFEEWKAKYQHEASPEKLAAFAKSSAKH